MATQRPQLHTDADVHHVLSGFLTRLEGVGKEVINDLEHLAATKGQTLADDAGETLTKVAGAALGSLLGGGGFAGGMGSYIDIGGVISHTGQAIGDIFK